MKAGSALPRATAWPPQARGPPGGRPACMERLEAAALPARPSSQTGHRGADRSGPLTPGERRAADLGTRADRPRPAVRALVTIETSAVRVLGRGGGSLRSGGGGPGRVCLTQRGELERRIHRATHQLAEGASGLSSVDRRGEHVFGKPTIAVGRKRPFARVLAAAWRDPAGRAAHRKPVRA